MTVIPYAAGKLPGLGHAGAFSRDPLRFLDGLRQQGDLLRVVIGSVPVLYLGHPDYVHEASVTRASSMHTGRLLRRMNPIFKNTVIVDLPKQHTAHRKALQPKFSKEASAAHSLQGAEAGVQALPWRDGTVVDVTTDVRGMLWANSLQHFLAPGVPAEQVPRVEELYTGVSRAFMIRMLLPSWLDKVPTPFNRRFERECAEFLKILAPYATGPYQQFMGEIFTPEEVLHHTALLVFTGVETPASILAWVLHYASLDPGLSERALAEPVFLDAVLYEALRLYPSLMQTRAATEPVTIGGQAFPAGQEMMLSFYALQRDPRFFSQPERWLPERWLPDAEPVSRKAFIPFGTGPRRCLGEHHGMAIMRTHLRSLLQAWQFEPVAAHRVRMDPWLTVRPGDLRLRVHRKI